MSEHKDWNKAIIEEFRANKGKVGGHFENSSLLLLHTTGAKSGKSRINPVMYLEDKNRILIFASKAGAPSNPDWYHNLVANPELTIELGSEEFNVTATIAEEPERTELYRKMAGLNSGFAEYEKKTNRKIPVVILTR
jgi:deazaflavin-dependent oxidoreductase (nitroreductase family)